MRTTQIHCVELIWMLVGRLRDSEGAKRGPGPKISILPRWKFFNGGTSPSFSQFIIDPKMSLTCDMSQIWTDVFEKNPLFWIPYLGQKRPFFGPEGPILTQNLKNIVKQVVITQNNAFLGLKWPPSNNVIFGVCRAPQTPLGPPRPPQWPQGAKIGRNALVLVQCW